jgi:hypothetical protein
MSRPLRFFLIAVLGALGTAPLATAAPAGQERFTPVTASVVAAPQPVRASDGRRHLAYELLLINRSFNPPAKVTVNSVKALAGNKVMESLTGRSLAAVMFPFGGTKPGVELAKGEAAYVMMDVSLPRGAKLPKRLVHRLSISPQPENEVVAKSYEAAPTSVVQREAVVVAPPLRGDGWIVSNGCCAELTSHRAGLLPVDGGLHEGERFAPLRACSPPARSSSCRATPSSATKSSPRHPARSSRRSTAGRRRRRERCRR